MLCEKARALGLTNRRTKKPLARGSIHYLLRNRVYYGLSNGLGTLYMPDITPIVPYPLFERCQRILQERDLNPQKIAGKTFILKRLLRCGTCGALITFVRKKNRYTYAYCDACRYAKRPFYRIREELLLAQFQEHLNRLCLPEELYGAAEKALTRIIEKNRAHGLGGILDRTGTRLAEVRAALARLTDAFLGGSIDHENYAGRLMSLKAEESSLKAALEKDDRAADPYDNLLQLLGITQHGGKWFREGTDEEKRLLIGFIQTETMLHGRNIEITLRFPIDQLWGRELKRNGGRYRT